MPNKPALPDMRHIAATVQGSQPGRALEGARSLPIDLIDPNPAQARQVFDKQALDELVASIRAHGVLEPILVRPAGERYSVVAGERRLRAASMAGLDAIPAIIRALTDEEAAYATAVENLQRADLDIEDEARQFQALLDLTGLSQRDLAKKLGIDREYLSRRIRLLKRPDLMQHVRAGALTLMAALAAMVEAERLTEQVTGNTPVLALAEPQDAPVVDDPPRHLTERAVLDQDTGYQGQPEPPTWRRRPLDEFGSWLVKMSPAVVPPPERADVRRKIASIRAHLDQWEAALED